MAAISNGGSCCFINDEVVNEHEAYVPYINKLNRSSLMRRSISSSGYASSPKRRHYEVRFDQQQPHFLECCYLCRKSIAADADIFMYRGDTPFCSEECRMEQIEMDEAKEKQRNVSMKSGLQASSNPNNAEGFSCMVVTAQTTTCPYG